MEAAELILKYIDALVWPVVTVFILLYFKDELSRLIDRAKKVDLPGGISIEAFERKLEKVKQLEQEVTSEIPPKAASINQPPNTTEASEEIVDLRSKSSIRGLNGDFYRELAKSDQQLAIAGLRIDLEVMIKNLAKGLGVQLKGSESPTEVIERLYERDYINFKQAEFMNSILQLSSYALHSVRVTKEQVYSLIDLSETLNQLIEKKS